MASVHRSTLEFLIRTLAKFPSRVGLATRNIMSMSELAGETPAPGLLKILEANPKRLKRIRFLSELFKSNGFELRIAGGAVRDIIRGKEPKDIDFATTARPEQSLAIVSKHEDLLRIIITTAGQRHGTVAVKFKEIEGSDELQLKRPKTTIDNPTKPEYDDESPYEITTLRCDKFTDGRHAEVEFIKDWRQDAERRDLTINAMFLTLDEGQLIDYYDGERDLNEGIVRFVGNAEQRIREDYLRIMRFFRFWSRYSRGRRPDDETLAKLRNNLDGLNQISGERIWQEIKKTLTHLPCYDVVELMLELRLFDYAGLKDDELEDYNAYIRIVLDEIKLVQENVQRYLSDHHHHNGQDRRIVDLLPVILFATTVQSENLCLNSYKRVKFSNIERDTILYIIQNRNKDPPLSAYKYQLAIAQAPERHLVMQRIKAFLIFKGKFEAIKKLEAWEVPTFPLSGNVVAKAVRDRKLPGKATRGVMDALKLEWAKQDYETTEEDLIELMRVKVNELVEAAK